MSDNFIIKYSHCTRSFNSYKYSMDDKNIYKYSMNK